MASQEKESHGPTGDPTGTGRGILMVLTIEQAKTWSWKFDMQFLHNGPDKRPSFCILLSSILVHICYSAVPHVQRLLYIFI